ncbi:MAG: response regulator [Deltaproteobacteria bacterium]|nr:response regulator [Deltaproteobacteria bacterium]
MIKKEDSASPDTARSKPNPGQKQAPARGPAPLIDPTNSRSSEVVLIIDDEEIVRTACSGILSRAGYRVMTAADGKSGIELFDQMAAETRCIMLDLSMPYLRGNVVFARLKAIDPTVPVYVMSGYCDEQIVRDFTAAGVSGFVHKPFQPETLIEAVKKADREVTRTVANL